MALVCCALASEKGAALGDSGGSGHHASPPSPSRSTGLPWDGALEGAVRLHPNAFVRPIAKYARGGNFYGTSELVGLIERAARAVAARWPDSQLTIGELSAAHGGKLDGHHSHRSGRDVDVAFFMRDARGRSSRFWRFVTFGSAGVALHTPRKLYFDDARNWTMVSTMLRDQVARVQYMFVSHAIRTRLLMEGWRRGESNGFLRAAAAVLVQPKEGNKHRNHFHVRIYCARDDRPACQDSAPYWPWYDGIPPVGEHAELPIIRWHMPDTGRNQHASNTRSPSASRAD